MTRKNWGDRHLGHLPRRLIMDDETSLETNLNDDRVMLKTRRVKREMDGPRKGLEDEP